MKTSQKQRKKLLKSPKQIHFGSNEISYDYDASGIKWKKSGGNGTHMYYCGNFVYDDNGLSYILMEEGRLLPAAGGFTYEYFLRDHLGNTRVSFIATGDTLMRTQEDSYYPFGMRQGGLGYSNGVENKYLYNGKELQDDDLGSTKLGWYDFGARFYDAAIARWSVIDPMSEKHYDYTGYAYVFNNPIVLIDMFGLDSVYILDQANRPADNGTRGTSYTADVYVIQNGELVYVGQNEKSTYPNSKSITDNSAKYNTVDEGEHNFDNKYGHKNSSKKGLNIYDDPKSRTVSGTKPDGTPVEGGMTGVNDHEGTSNNGGPSSRGSEGCITTDPAASESFYSVFDWSGTITRQTSDGPKTYTGTTGNSSGKYYIYRGTANMPANFRNDHKLPTIIPAVIISAKKK